MIAARGRSQQAASKHLLDLETAGYVERRECEDDGRGHLVAITEAGRAMRRKMWPVYARAIEAAIGQRLSARQAETLGDLLGLLIEAEPAER